MEEWKEVRLEECVSLLGDGLHGTPKYTENGEYAFINGNNLINGKIVIKPETKRVNEDEYLKYKKNLTDRTIFVSINGTIGNVGTYNGEKIILGKSACYFNVLDGIDKAFIKYIVSSPSFKTYLETNATGTTIKNVSLAQMRNYSFLLPPLPTQQKIAAIISSLDDKIELNNKINDNLEQQAQAIFKNCFVGNSEKTHTIGEYIVPHRGKNLLSKDAVFGDVPVIAGGLEPATYHNVANTKAPVLTISASGANAGYVNLWNIPVWSSDSSYIDSEMTKDVYFWYILLKLRQKEIFDSQTGSAQPHIYPQHISVLPISELDYKKVSLFTKQVTPFFEKIGATHQENLNLIALRNTLLPKLMSGELDVDSVQL